MKFDVVNTKKETVGSVELDDSVFAAHVKPWLFYEVVKMQLANKRSGTHKTKTVTEVSGTGKRPYRQKGTGRARHGSTHAVGMRGGGISHGPRPRDYSYQMPKKMVRGALRSALSLRTKEDKLHVIQGWAPKAPKTKAAKEVLDRFAARKALIVDTAENLGLARSVSNIPHVKFLPVEALNVYDILLHDDLFISEGAVEAITQRLKTAPSRKDKALSGEAA